MSLSIVSMPMVHSECALKQRRRSLSSNLASPTENQEFIGIRQLTHNLITVPVKMLGVAFLVLLLASAILAGITSVILLEAKAYSGARLVLLC